MFRLSSVMLIMILLAAVALVRIDASRAAEFRYKEESLTVIDREEGLKDLYIFGGNVTVNNRIGGDLVVFGGSILINGSVENSLFVAGGQVTIRGAVGRHLRLAGGTVVVSGSVGGDLLMAGGTLAVNNTAQVGGDLILTGGTVELNGSINGQTVISGGSVVLNGKFNDVRAKVNNLTIGSQAIISGDLTYEAAREAVISEGAVIAGSIKYQPSANPYLKQWRNFFTTPSLLRLLGSILLAMILLRFWPRSVAGVVNEHGLAKPWEAFGYGLFVVLLVPIVLFFLAISAVGVPLAVVVGFFWLFMLALGGLIGKLIVGHLLFRRLSDSNHQLNWRSATLGIIVVNVLSLVPFIGTIIGATVFIVGVGSLARKFRYLTDGVLVQPLK